MMHNLPLKLLTLAVELGQHLRRVKRRLLSLLKMRRRLRLKPMQKRQTLGI